MSFYKSPNHPDMFPNIFDYLHHFNLIIFTFLLQVSLPFVSNKLLATIFTSKSHLFLTKKKFFNIVNVIDTIQ